MADYYTVAQQARHSSSCARAELSVINVKHSRDEKLIPSTYHSQELFKVIRGHVT